MIKMIDLERAVSGTRSAGIVIARIEIDVKNGRIIIVAGGPSGDPDLNDLDAELAARLQHTRI